ncbi:MAG: organoarsenical effux MFS transporter ArsJ [Gammaproteobacteria bacterium]
MHNLRHYLLVTLSYWGFTLTDGALRMLVLLHFHNLGYSPLQIAFLFLFYEFFGIVTNLLGGWLGAVMGLRATLLAGISLQIVALSMLALLDPQWPVALAVSYVMFAQALSGIAKDLTKMSSKSALKFVVHENAQGTLFKWVAILTGSKNALKGVGFFMGGLLLSTIGFASSLYVMATALLVILVSSVLLLPSDMGKAKSKKKWQHLFAKSRAINILSFARLFLFGSRDVWFVVGLPLFLATQLQWSHMQVGSFLASWVIGYGIIQSLVPGFIRQHIPTGKTAFYWVSILTMVPVLIIVALGADFAIRNSLIAGLALFALIFAINSAIHSYLVLAYTDHDNVTMDVGFYYMANAAGRLTGTVLSGYLYQEAGLAGCLWVSVAFILIASIVTRLLPEKNPT